MIQILEPARRENLTDRWHRFDDAAQPGFAERYFDLDAEGNLDLSNYSLEAKVRIQHLYAEALTCGTIDGKPVTDMGLQERTRTILHGAIGRCACGEKLALDAFTNTCECGRAYNWAGQELARGRFLDDIDGTGTPWDYE